LHDLYPHFLENSHFHSHITNILDTLSHNRAM
jgi:hypothetical protein